MKKVIKFLSILLIVLVVAFIGFLGYVMTSMPNVKDAPAITVEADSASVANGMYLAHSVALCMDCHSTRDWNLFSAPPVAGTIGAGGELFDQKMGFPGIYYSKNITPSALKDWTDGEIYRAITAGVSKDGTPLFPVMPFHYYGQLDDEDIHDIIAYVRTLQPIENDVPESKSDFPFNIIIRTIPKDGTPSKKPERSNTLAYGKYMATMSGCVECHSQVEKGRIITGTEYGGGRTFMLPGGILTSSNITPHNTGIGSWSKDVFIQKFKQYTDSSYVPAKIDFMKEYNSIMPWMMYATMKEEDLGAIYEYLKSLEPIDHSIVKWVSNGG